MLYVPLDCQCAEWQNCPRQLAMQSCALCLYVRCWTSNQTPLSNSRKVAFLMYAEMFNLSLKASKKL